MMETESDFNIRYELGNQTLADVTANRDFLAGLLGLQNTSFSEFFTSEDTDGLYSTGTMGDNTVIFSFTAEHFTPEEQYIPDTYIFFVKGEQTMKAYGTPDTRDDDIVGFSCLETSPAGTSYPPKLLFQINNM